MNGLTEAEARALARRVANESDGVVRFGRTNGLVCLHVRCERQSNTIYSEAEWDSHRWNRNNRPRKREASADLFEAISNKQ